MSKEKDITEKVLLGCNDVFADVANGFFCDGDSVIDPKGLTDSTTTSQFKAAGKVHEQERDVAKFWSQAGTRIAIIGIENQSKPDPDMPLRVMGYDGASYKEQALQHDAAERDKTIKRLPPYPSITLVINYGKTPWGSPTSLLECIGAENIPERLRPYFNDYKIHVFNIVTMKKDDLKRFKSDFRHVAEVLWSECNNVPYEPSEEQLVHADKTLKMISALTHSNRFLEAYQSIPENEKQGGISMCRVANEIEARGEARGMARGMDIVTGVYCSFMRNRSVPETAKENGLSEKEATDILRKLQILPM